MRTIIAIVLGVFITQTLSAQNDSLIIKLENFGQMLIVSPDFTNEAIKTIGIDDAYQRFYEEFVKINPSVFKKEHYLIKYVESKDELKTKRISLEESENQIDEYFFQDGKHQSRLSFNFQIKLDLKNEVIIYLDSLPDFQRIKILNLDSLYLQSLSEFQSEKLRKKYPYLIFYNSSNNKINNKSSLIFSGKTNDYIILYPTFGASIISTTISPEINLNMDISLGKKGLVYQKFGISNTFLFMPNKNDFYNVKTYYLVNANYYLKFNKKWSHKVSLGYMYAGNGDDFSKNTWNFYWQTSVKDIGFKLGSFYTKNTEGNYVFLPSIGFDFGF
ncbi:MAG: hypothetical protein P1P88_12425 [Bacteroidales bacterium]|nr:hypothetical protein [Bacteroidales bacterium]